MVIQIDVHFCFSCPLLFGSLDIGEVCKRNCFSCQHPFMFILKVSLQIKAFPVDKIFFSADISYKRHHLELMEHDVYDILFSW